VFPLCLYIKPQKHNTPGEFSPGVFIFQGAT
jgi:hypothetical protein